MPDTFPYDVFLSHNRADKPRVRRLAERLRAAGLRQDDFGFRISDFGFPPKAAWVGLERSTLLFRDPTRQCDAVTEDTGFSVWEMSTSG